MGRPSHHPAILRLNGRCASRKPIEAHDPDAPEYPFCDLACRSAARYEHARLWGHALIFLGFSDERG
jgi:hypothetical protein